MRFNEAGATIAPEIPPPSRGGPGAIQRFNEAGATIAPEMRRLGCAHGSWTPASMRPGQQSPRKWWRVCGSAARCSCFNEAGATIAPEIGLHVDGGIYIAPASMRPGQQSPRKSCRYPVPDLVEFLLQ